MHTLPPDYMDTSIKAMSTVLARCQQLADQRDALLEACKALHESQDTEPPCTFDARQAIAKAQE